MILRSLVFTQYQHVTDRHTDWCGRLSLCIAVLSYFATKKSATVARRSAVNKADYAYSRCVVGDRSQRQVLTWVAGSVAWLRR